MMGRTLRSSAPGWVGLAEHDVLIEGVDELKRCKELVAVNPGLSREALSCCDYRWFVLAPALLQPGGIVVDERRSDLLADGLGVW